MKKLLLLVTMLLTLSLCACAADTPAPAPDVTPDTPQETPNTPDTPEDGQTVDLPILNEIDQTVRVGTSGSYMTAVQATVKLLDWGVDTGLDPEEIRAATAAWLGNMGNDAQTAFADKLALVDNAYQSLLKDGAEDLLSSAGCTDTAYPWSTEPVESIEAIMEAAGLRA